MITQKETTKEAKANARKIIKYFKKYRFKLNTKKYTFF